MPRIYRPQLSNSDNDNEEYEYITPPVWNHKLVAAACNGCTAAGHILPGHFACFPDAMVAEVRGWRYIERRYGSPSGDQSNQFWYAYMTGPEEISR